MSDKPDTRKPHEKWPIKPLMYVLYGAMYVLGTVNELIDKAKKKK